MPQQLTLRVRPRLGLVAVLLLLAFVAATARTATAATPLTVAQAVATQDDSVRTVRGFIVGEPVATTTVNRSGFSGDLAIALADTAGERSTSKMVYVQLTTQWRSTPNPTTTTTIPSTTTSPTTSPGPTGTTGPYDSTYYANAIGKSGSALRTSLHSIIRSQTVLTYDQVWEALKDTDQDPGNADNVIEIYSGRSIAKSDNGGGVDQWNREHVWAKSHGDFGTANGPGTDLHHLRPEDATVNSTRGNLDFDNGGTAVSQCGGCFSDSDSFEPRDAVKGDVARMIFYMAIRYEGDDGWPDLEPDNSVANGTSPYIGKLSVLKAWSAGDPPDTFEKRRNQVIYDTWQHNRNPFVDHPEWVASIWP